MSDFRKPFEYEEEKGMPAFLMVFFVMLLTFEVLLGAATMVQGYGAFKDTPALSSTVLAVGSAYLLLILAACIALRKSFRHGVALSKVFLIVRVLLLVPVYVVLYVLLMRQTAAGNAGISILIPGSSPALRSPIAILMTRLIGPIGYIVVFSAAWYAYFLKSKKVRHLQEAPPKTS